MVEELRAVYMSKSDVSGYNPDTERTVINGNCIRIWLPTSELSELWYVNV